LPFRTTGSDGRGIDIGPHFRFRFRLLVAAVAGTAAARVAAAAAQGGPQ